MFRYHDHECIFCLQHYTDVDYVEIRSSGAIRLDPRFHIEQNSTKNDFADVSITSDHVL